MLGTTTLNSSPQYGYVMLAALEYIRRSGGRLTKTKFSRTDGLSYFLLIVLRAELRYKNDSVRRLERVFS